MDIRISHCSTSLENYYICIEEKVDGFTNRGPNPGDLVYLVVKIGKTSYCGARFILDEITDYKPWPDAERYVHALTIKEIELCEPFDISILAEVGGKYWAVKYIQGAKPIREEKAISILNETFQKNIIDELYRFPNEQSESDIEVEYQINEDEIFEDEKEAQKLVEEVPEVRIDIMGTFQTIHFANETDKIRGLEILVNNNFYSLFPHFSENRTLLIPENRIFKTKGIKKDGRDIQGIRSIPDGLLFVFNKNQKKPIQINLIEYECYGEKKTRGTDKSNYLNTTIIPQLMRFASAFSIITDENTRRATIEKWVDKIIDYINSNEELSNKIIGWIRELNPKIKERSIEREIEKILIDAFKTNLRVLLVIDELSTEQKSTIQNVISSFKLENGDNIQFVGYVVRLVQSISITDHTAQYALTVQ